ncbi:hypothetical protein NQ318_008701 [Aromia moschata]|uniref:THAP-type domain-containing protein n=1 Tax=Aromia moschata TaxID=1265417 RepID=A0AAV8X5X7_9CUCU|nr:hypothetical protein NQ318_008701 [Aromia moschata]
MKVFKMVCCAIRNCKSDTRMHSKAKNGITFHLFPKGYILRSKWLEVVCRPSWSPSARSVICSLHFTNDSFYTTKKGFVKLISGSIPSLLLPPKPVTARKEPAKRLTLEQKLDLINHAKTGVKNVDLCKMYNICKSSVAEILGKKEIYLSEVEKRRKLSGRIDTKKCTGTYDTPFEISVFHWFVQRRTLVEPVSGVLLREGDFLFAEFCDNRNV